MRVLIVHHSAALDSSRAFFSALAAYPAIELTVLGPQKGWNPLRETWQEIPEKSFQDGYTLCPGKVFRARSDFSGPYMTGLCMTIRRFRPHIIHVFNEAMSWAVLQVLVCAKLFSPRSKVLFYGFENLFPDDFPRKNWKRRIQWFLLNRYLDGGLYANSEGIGRLRSLGFTRPKIQLAYWGIPIETYRNVRSLELRRELGLEGKLILGYVGRVVQMKGLDIVLASLKALPPHIVFVSIGSGNDLTRLREIAASKGVAERFITLPRVKEFDVPRYISLFDLFVLPSQTTPFWKEQFGRVIAEAMACGVPVLGSSSGAIPEIIGNGGFVFKEGDAMDFVRQAKRFQEMSPTERAFLKRKALERAERHFSLASFARRFTDYYDDIMAKKPR